MSRRLSAGATDEVHHYPEFFKRHICDAGRRAASQMLVRTAAINPEMQGDVMVRAQPFVLVISHLESALELFIEWHDMVSLCDRLELSADEAWLSSSWLEFLPCSAYPGSLAGEIFAEQLALY
ncbi:MAG: hypothetical protein ABI192_14210 [Bradyrhizobium sp.]